MSGSQQLLLGGDDGFVFNVVIGSNTANYNLRSAAIAAGWDQIKPLRASLTVNAGIYLYASSTGVYALNASGSFPSGSSLSITNNGYIVGCGGTGATSQSQSVSWAGGSDEFDPCVRLSFSTFSASAAGNGGPAVITSLPTTVTNNGVIGGGGGGGGGGSAGGVDPSDGYGARSWFPGGGGGAGQSFQLITGGNSASFTNQSVYSCSDIYPISGVPNTYSFTSSPGAPASNGTLGGGGGGANWSSGGCYAYGGPGGNGGSWGAQGNSGSPGGGSRWQPISGCTVVYNQVGGLGPGAGGACLVGNSFVTWAVQGNRYGAII